MVKLKECRLYELADINMGQSPPSEFYNEIGEGTPFFQGVTEFTRLHPLIKIFTTKVTKTASKNSILMSVRAPVGDLNITDRDCCIGRGLCAIKSKEKNLFVFYLLAANRKKIQSYSNGAIYESINQDTLKNISFLVPSIEQDRTKISTILFNYDNLIENNTRRIQLLEQTAKLVYDEWFVKFKFPSHEKTKMIDSELGKIPEEWEVKKLYDIVDIQKGLSYASENLVDDGKIAFVNLKCFDRGGGFRYDGVKRFQGDFKEKHIVRCGDIVVAVTDMTQDRAIVARAARIPKLNENTIIISMDVVKMNPKNELDKSWLFGFLNYSSFGVKMKEFANGVNVLHLKSDPMGEYQFVMPNQKTIEAYSQIVSGIYQEIDDLQLKNMNLAATRDLLLPKLISGEIDVSGLDIRVSEVTA